MANRQHNIPSNLKRLEKQLRRETGRAIQTYNMIEEGDHVMVCMSGGKDSFTLLDLLLRLRERAPVNFELTAVNLDQHHPGFPVAQLERYLSTLDVPFQMLRQDTYSIVKRVIPDGKTMCGLCSRLRRGVLYKAAEQLEANKIALGHHLDDIVETLFLNMFYGGRLKAMPPKLLSDDGAHIVIRPLAQCREKNIARYALLRDFPVIPCNLCGAQTNLQRQAIKRMLAGWEQQNPGRVTSIFRSLSNIAPSQLADPQLFNFAELGARSVPSSWLPEGSNHRDPNTAR